MSQYHTPVLLEESVDLLAVDPAGTYVCLLYTSDAADERSSVEQVDGILADLGVSSHHFDAVERGFSFRGEAPLDMRMNQRGALTAARVVNGYPADALTRLLGDWGELETPWKIANCIVRAREAAPIETTAQLVEAVKPCTPKKDESKFLTKLFQALRIEVNGEMEALKMALEQSLRVLKPGGKVVILEFSTPRNPLFRRVYGLYSHRLLPAIGGMISKDRKAYEYLPASVDEFPAPECFMAMMREAGFKDCRARSQSLGIAQIYTGEK